MSVKSKQAIAAQIRSLIGSGVVHVSDELLEEWANAIDPIGFLVTGLDAAGLVRHLSRCNALTDVLREAASMYGFTLEIDDAVANQLNTVSPAEAQVGRHIASMLTKAEYPRGMWLDYSVCFRVTDANEIDIATEGCVQRDAAGDCNKRYTMEELCEAFDVDANIFRSKDDA